ncbi:MAG TPA: hypothetical protein VGR93_03380 [Candidatus Acidoferrales bacterium]|nr:hypothetical protein [Candidatus Acidoferrales bacterium]
MAKQADKRANPRSLAQDPTCTIVVFRLLVTRHSPLVTVFTYTASVALGGGMGDGGGCGVTTG